MDRHNSLHKASRVDLGEALDWMSLTSHPENDSMKSAELFPGALQSRRARLLGRVGLWTSSIMVIATASLLALWVS